MVVFFVTQMKSCDQINIRDPFVLLHQGKYYMYGTRGETAFVGEAFGFDVYVSDDLEHWYGPTEVFHRPEGFWSKKSYWAPEVHKYNGKFYMFASFSHVKGGLGTAILVADDPMGPFTLWSDGYVTPKQWRCLDGTFYVDDLGDPYLIFCHEWREVRDGTICAIRLSEDLKRSCGKPQELFAASQAKPFVRKYFLRHYVTDGPFLIRSEDGILHMLWSTYGKGGYVEAVAHSDTQQLQGTWQVEPQFLYDADGGHGMIFRDKQGEFNLALHSPNTFKKEHPKFIPLVYSNGCFLIKKS